jgi:hypothetical protein
MLWGKILDLLIVEISCRLVFMTSNIDLLLSAFSNENQMHQQK